MKNHNAFTLVELLVIIAIIGILLAALPAKTVGTFCFGWINGTFRLVDGLKHELVAVGIGVVALILLPLAVHFFIRHLVSSPTRWSFRQSVAVVGLVCSLIIATIGFIALIHEVYWLAHPKEPVTKVVGVDWVK